MKKRIAAFLLALCLLLTSCGGDNKASAMNLIRTEGTVGVRDEGGKDVKLRDPLKLYSGYGVSTRTESYAWIDLDSVKLAKLDADSEIEIQKDEKNLEIVLTGGSIFFNVKEPLAEDETMTIRNSTMAVGIRGTCGWVSAADERHMTVHILEGTVVCTVTDSSGRVTEASVSAGESAAMSITGEGTGQIALGTFSEYGVPAFVLSEIKDDGSLAQAVAGASGLELAGWDADAAFSQALASIACYGDAALTPEQSAAFAAVLREEISKAEDTFDPSFAYYFGTSGTVKPTALAGLVNIDGSPALLFGSAVEIIDEYGTWMAGGNATSWGIWEYADGQAVQYQDPGRTQVYPGYLLTGGHYIADPGYSASVYPFVNGRISTTASTSAQQNYDWNGRQDIITYAIDGREATEAQFDAWRARWDPGNSLAGYDHGSDVSLSLWGLSPAESVLSVLEGNGPLTETGQETPAANRFVTSYEPGSIIRRTTADNGSLPLKIFYEIPVFPETAEGYGVINAFYQAKQDEFFASAIEWDREMAREYHNSYDEPFSDCWYAGVTAQTDSLVSVLQVLDYYMGSPGDSTEAHTFRVDTGEELKLTDVVNATDAQIREAIVTYCSRLEDAVYYIDFETLRGRSADEFTFYIQDNSAVITFETYECTIGKSVIEDIILPFPLNF